MIIVPECSDEERNLPMMIIVPLSYACGSGVRERERETKIKSGCQALLFTSALRFLEVNFKYIWPENLIEGSSPS